VVNYLEDESWFIELVYLCIYLCAYFSLERIVGEKRMNFYTDTEEQLYAVQATWSLN